jgi:radical SAM-linked protein
MIGLPTETDSDIRELVDLIREVGRIGKKFKGHKNVNASIGTFVPKSFTPFQWDRFEDLNVTTERLSYLKSAVRFPFARLKWHNPKECFIESVLSRGDRRVGRALLKAYQLGCRFDGWDEMFNFDLWMRAFEESGVDPHFYNRDIALDEVLPWEFIDIGVSKKFLLKERERSYEQVQTYDCKWGDCRGCGIPGNYADIKLAEVPQQVAQESLVQLMGPALAEMPKLASPIAKPNDHGNRENCEDKPPLPPRSFVLHYWKEGSARFLSHLNVMQLLERALVRCGFSLRFTEGFNPHPKFTSSPAIPLGMSSRCEHLQFEVYGELPADAVARLNECLIEGLTVQSILPFDSAARWKVTQPLQATYKASLERSRVNGDVPAWLELLGHINDLMNHLADHYKGNDFYCASKDHERIVDLWVESDDPLQLGFTLSVNPESGALFKPKDFLEQVLCCPSELAKKFSITKEAVAFQ